MAALRAKEECRRASLKRRKVRSLSPEVPQDATEHGYSKATLERRSQESERTGAQWSGGERICDICWVRSDTDGYMRKQWFACDVCLRCNEQGIRPFYGYSSELSEDDEPKTQVELPYWDDAAECWLEAPGVAACDVDVDQGPGSHDDDERARNKKMTTEIPGGASEHAEDEEEATLEHCDELAAMGVALAKSANLLPEVRTREPTENEYMCAWSPIMSSRVGACIEADRK